MLFLYQDWYDYCVPEIVSDVTTCVAFAGGIPSLRPVIFDVSSLIILPGLGGGKGKLTKYPFSQKFEAGPQF